MTVPKSRAGVLKQFENASPEVKKAFQHLPAILERLPLDVALSYVFAQLELGHNMALYCGVVKKHRANREVARAAVETHHLTRSGFRARFDTVFGIEFPDKLTKAITPAEEVRDRVMHGKAATEAKKREAISAALNYAEEFNKIVHKAAGIKPFGSLKGFKGRAQSLDKATTRWLLKGMGFSLS